MVLYNEYTAVSNNAGDIRHNENISEEVEQEENENSMVQLFVEYVTQPDYDNEEKVKLIRWLVYNKGWDKIKDQWKVKNYLKLILPTLLAYKNDVNYIGTRCQTILHKFIAYYAKKVRLCSEDQSLKDSIIVKTLMEKGASIVILDCDGNTPLGMAVVKGRIDLVRIMLRYSISADLNTQNILGDTILHIMIDEYSKSNDNWEHYFKYIEEIHNLLSYGANPNQADFTGRTPVHLAAKHCFVEILQLFKQFEANFDALTNIGDDLLMVVCFEIKQIKDSRALLKTINLLLEQGCNVKHRNDSGFTCLHYASQTHRLTVLDRLVRAGADVNAIAEDGSTPLHSATMLGTLETVEYLLNCGADRLSRENFYGFTLLHTAAFNRDEKMLQKVIERKFRFNDLFEDQKILRIIYKRLDLNDFCENGFTPLHLAVLSGNCKVVKELIKLGADVNCRDKDGQCTPLHLAAMGGQLSNLKSWFDYRWTSFSLMRKCLELVDSQEEEFNCQVIDALVKAGADVNAKDVSLRTPLHFAALRPNCDVVSILLKRGALVDAQDNEGLLPLHNVLNSGNLQSLDYLIRYGADVNDIENPCNTFIEVMSWQKPVANHLLKHVVKLQAADLPVSDLYKTYLDDPKLRDYSIKCLKEVEKLKDSNLTSTMCFYNLLQRNSRRKFTFIDDLPFDYITNQFPIYVNVIIGSYRASCARKLQVHSAKLAFEQLTIAYWPDLCLDNIFRFLSNKDLRALIDNMENMLRKKFEILDRLEQKKVIRVEPTSFRAFRVYELRAAFRTA